MEGRRVQVWNPEAAMPEDEVAECTIRTGIAYRAETGERLGVLQVYSVEDARELILETWFTADVAEKLLADLGEMRTWFGLGSRSSQYKSSEVN